MTANSANVLGLKCNAHMSYIGCNLNGHAGASGPCAKGTRRQLVVLLSLFMFFTFLKTFLLMCVCLGRFWYSTCTCSHGCSFLLLRHHARLSPWFWRCSTSWCATLSWVGTCHAWKACPTWCVFQNLLQGQAEKGNLCTQALAKQWFAFTRSVQLLDTWHSKTCQYQHCMWRQGSKKFKLQLQN